MKKTLLFIVIAFASLTASAQNITGKCYRGYADVGYTIGTGDFNMGRFELNVAHGYQIDPFFFVGAGLGLHFMPEYKTANMVVPLDSRESKVDIPIYANVKFNMGKGKFVPFLDVRGGTYVTNNSGIYMNVSAGLRIATNEIQAVNISIGYTRAEFEFETFEDFYDFKSMAYTTSPNKYATEGITIKVGYEF